MEQLKSVPNHTPRRAGNDVQKRIRALKVGQKMQDLPEELWHASFRYYVKEDAHRQGGPNLRMIRLDPNKPSLTVTGYIFNKFVHPHFHRFITPREAARLQGFPDNFIFSGPLTKVQAQVGNAVPVQLASAIGDTILRHVEEYHPFGIGKKLYRHKNFPFISVFSGAGGLDLGLERSSHHGYSFKSKLSVEIDSTCCETLRLNFPHLKVIEGDIKNVSAQELLKSFGSKVVPLLVGGPPCQSFSQAGKQTGKFDDRGQLIFDFIRILAAMRPIYFIMENVSGLKSIHKGAFLKEIINKMISLGYNVTHEILCAADYGSPQLRRRYIIMGCLNDYPPLQLPTPTHGEHLSSPGLRPYVGVGEAFEGLP